jgi:hypothetical protein
LLLALALGGTSAAALAIPIADMKVEDLMPMGPDFMQELKLTPNQTRLWQQVEGKTRQLMRERRARRDRLDGALKNQLAQPTIELRDLAGAMDSETATTAAEEKQLRGLWLDVNDALDQQQRQQVAGFISAQMSRVMDGGPAHGGGGGDKERGGGGGRGGKPPGGGGGGMGLNVGGNGGVGVSMPGSY